MPARISAFIMCAAIDNLQELLRSLRPVRHPGVVVFCSLPPDFSPGSTPCIGVFQEAEGVTVIASEEIAIASGWTVLFRAAWITLTVHSDLHAVGLTAAVASALANAGISCNVVAAANHDHLFVPVAMGDAAMAALMRLQAEAGASSGSGSVGYGPLGLEEGG